MDNSQKPFACPVEGCEMTFTNEDHLNWHHKKHDMVLNFGLASKSAEVSDQTPTPTRFIRNCEEVGLFQDLQNVNPFDETFKKAIEYAKSGTLHVPDITSNDDTLHTPHIFPPVDSTNVKYVDTRNDNQSTQSNDFCISNVPSIDNSNEPTESYDLTIETGEPVGGNMKSEHSDLKNKLKETIKNKAKTPVINPVPLDKLKANENEPPQKTPQSNNFIVNRNQRKDSVSDERAKIREMNRAAQLRCRKRKQVQWKQMEEDAKILKIENAYLRQENQNFKQKFYDLKELLVKHRSSNTKDDIPLLKKMEEILNCSSSVAKGSPASQNTSNRPKILRKKIIKTSSIVPVPVQSSANEEKKQPLLIQVFGSVAQLAVSVLPNK